MTPVGPFRIGVVRLDDGAEHLLWRLTGRYILEQIVVVRFGKLDPAGGARGNKREWAAVLEPFEKLRPLFHDGEVRREVCIEDDVHPQFPKSGIHLSGDQRSRLEPKLLAQRHADRRRHLGNYRLLGVIDCAPCRIDILSLVERPYRTVDDALPTVDAGTRAHFELTGGSNHCFGASSLEENRADRLHIIADLYAPTTADALVHVAHNAHRASVDRQPPSGFLISELTHFELLGQVLKLAFPVFDAGKAVFGVCREHELEKAASHGAQCSGVCANMHAVASFGHAGSFVTTLSLDVDHAHAARPAGLQVLVVTQCGYIHARLFCGVENACAAFNGNRFIVNEQ